MRQLFPVRHMSAKARRQVILILVLALLSGWVVFQYYYPLVSRPLGEKPSWYGITPGDTHLLDALAILGDGYQAEYRDGYWAYSYEQLAEEFGWKLVEVWATDETSDRRVVGLYFQGPDRRRRDSQEVPNARKLYDLASRFGRPTEVLWGVYRYERAVMWAEKGVMVVATAYFNQPNFDWKDVNIRHVVLFEPMSTRAFLRTSLEWPWPYGPIWSPQNMYDTHSPDTAAQDPYDWDSLPFSP